VKEWNKGRKFTKARYYEIATRLGLTRDQVYKWFWRRKDKDKINRPLKGKN